MAGRLLLLQCLVFLLFLTFSTKQIESLLVYDRQSLFFLRQRIGNFTAFNHDGRNTLPPLQVGIPPHLYWASALPSRRKGPRRCGSRSGRLVKLKLWLSRSSSISRTGHGLLYPTQLTSAWCLSSAHLWDSSPAASALLGSLSGGWIIGSSGRCPGLPDPPDHGPQLPPGLAW